MPVERIPDRLTEQLPPEDEIGVFDLLVVLLSGWPIVFGTALIVGIGVAVWSLAMKPVFTASTTFMPEQRESSLATQTGLSTLAGQLGIPVGSSAGTSPRVYAVILKSQSIGQRILESRYPVPGNPSDSATLLTLLEVDGQNRAERIDRGLKALTSKTDIAVDNLTSVVRVSFNSAHPELSASVANRYVDLVNQFNVENRTSAAGNRNKFIEARRAEAERELRKSENALREFYENNRSWQQSPTLPFEQGRLSRQVELHQELYLTLSREYERTRIDQVNDVPAITVIDPAVPPLVRSAPRRRSMVMIGLVLGGFAGMLIVFADRYLESARKARGVDVGAWTSPVTRIRRYSRRMFGRA